MKFSGAIGRVSFRDHLCPHYKDNDLLMVPDNDLLMFPDNDLLMVPDNDLLMVPKTMVVSDELTRC
jgi:trehalose-6-phosphate synthase